jgi:hypothetical protein
VHQCTFPASFDTFLVWLARGSIQTRCINASDIGLSQRFRGYFAGGFVSNAPPHGGPPRREFPRSDRPANGSRGITGSLKEFVMGLAIVTLYVVSALAGAAGIGRQELRR